MAPLKFIDRALKGDCRAGFLLSEVTLCLGILAFVLVSVLGLMAGGLNIFREGMGMSVTSQISQRVLNDVQQSDYDALLTDYQNYPISGDGSTGLKPLRFFNEQGIEIIPADSTATDPLNSPAGLSAGEMAAVVYWVNTRVAATTTLPKATPVPRLNARLATVTVQVASNPGNQKLAFESGNPNDVNAPLRNLFSGCYYGKTDKVVPIQTFSAMVARAK